MSLAGTATSIIFITTKVLSQQKDACQDKSFVMTNLILSWQTFCCDKLTFVKTNSCLSRQNTSFVVTKVCLARQNICHDKHVFVICFVALSILLSRQKMCFVTTKDVFCHDKQLLSWQTWYMWQLPPMIQTWSFITGSHDPQWLMEHAQILSHLKKKKIASVLGTQPTVTSRVKLRCSSVEQFVLDSNTTSVYNFTLSSRCACPGLCHRRSEKESELSVGTILVLIFFSALMLYLGVGEFWEWDGELL